MGKRLQIDFVEIKSVAFAEKSYLENGALYIDKQELLDKMQSDMFSSLQIELVAPGEDVRLLGVHDITQPRVKADEPEASFPGIWGNVKPAGEGRTVALRGVVVTELYPLKANLKYILDMSGPAAEVSHFSRHYHVVINASPVAGIDDVAYCKALKQAALTACVCLARLAIETVPSESKIYELTPVPPAADGSRLPRVAYITNHLAAFDTMQFFYYGISGQGILPLLVHPNDLLDGAFIYRYFYFTYYIQNDTVIYELYSRHGLDLDFAGVVLNNGQTVTKNKDVCTMVAVDLAKNHLQADIVITNKCGMHHLQLEQAMICEKCAELGIAAVAIMPTVSSEKPGDLLAVVNPHLDAVVHSAYVETITFPRVARLIGDSEIPSLLGVDLQGPFTKSTNLLLAGNLSELGDFYPTTDTELIRKEG
ncbi:MAG: hypothetical protein HPY66_2492 [Firmicutes bacterium]|nr:hypothetical protein [Bacillota bacterium]